MFYVMNEDRLSIFNDSLEKIETTRKYMPQLEGQLTLETDIVDAETLETHPNKVIVDDVPVEIDVPDVDEEGNPVYIDVPIYDEEGNIIGYDKVPSTHKETIYVKGIVLNPNYEQEEAEKETARINNLTMTALDFIKVLKSFGLTTAEIHAYLDTNLDLKDELTFCQNVYCGVVRALLPLNVASHTITDEMVVASFKAKNGEV